MRVDSSETVENDRVILDVPIYVQMADLDLASKTNDCIR